RLHILHNCDELTVAGQPGDLVSLIPLHGRAEGITLHGFRYPLHDAVLEPGSTLGVSNELTGSAGRVALLVGTLVVIQPTALKEF
ncbi:MAG: thiamine diphosphokinase, partial [Acidimicrobiia bacterium]|nr:thiamine diphosphokinase [Acidimicrobiia bacterium]